MIVIYTDGSALNNGAKDAEGGFGVVVCETYGRDDPLDYKIIDAYAERARGTTNNRMEISAITWALRKYGKSRDCGIISPLVYSDSAYCVNTFNNWMKGWKAKGWKRSKGQTVENLDLIKEWDNLLNEGYSIDLRHIKGHNGHIWNELADDLATGKISVEEVINYENDSNF